MINGAGMEDKMKIQNVEDKKTQDNCPRNLDLDKLEENKEYVLLAYLLNYKTGMTVYEKGYYTFYVKDVNANVVSAKLFGVDKFLEEGFKAMIMKDKPVKIDFTAQIYNGLWSLIVHDIELWEGPFDYNNFIGRAEYREDIIEYAYQKCMSADIPREYFAEYFPEICDGRIGGFLSLLEKSFTKLYVYQFEFLDSGSFQKCFFISMHSYFQYLMLKKRYSIVPTKNIFQIINSVNLEYHDTDFIDELMETVLSLCGLAKPQHLWSHLICDTVKQTEEHLKLIYKNQTLPFGSSIKIDGKMLTRY